MTQKKQKKQKNFNFHVTREIGMNNYTSNHKATLQQK